MAKESKDSGRVTLLLLLALAFVLLHKDVRSASNLGVVPDSVEYAVGAERIVSQGRYDIVVDGRPLPPRYPPWFSLLLIAPCYALLGPELGYAIVPVTLLALLGVAAAYFIGRRLGGPWGGCLASLGLLALPDYRDWAQKIMTDVPSSALLLLAALQYLRVQRGAGRDLRSFALAGLLITLAAALRPISALAALPFAWRAATTGGARSRAARLLLLATPLAALGAATLAYNQETFGSPLRSGYHFWTPVPYDYPWLLLSISYLPSNLETAWSDAQLGPALLAMGAALLASRWLRGEHAPPDREPVGPLLLFVVLGILPIFLFHLLYFSNEARFFLPLVTLLAVTAGGLLGTVLASLPGRLRLAALLVGLAVASVQSWRGESPVPTRRLAAERLDRVLPRDALLITALDPVYLEPLLLRGTDRRLMLVTRQVEYAAKLIAWQKIEDPRPPPEHWADHRSPGLARGGAQEAVAQVMVESMDMLADELREGVPVFLDASHVTGAVEALEPHFELIERAPRIYELVARAE